MSSRRKQSKPKLLNDPQDNNNAESGAVSMATAATAAVNEPGSSTKSPNKPQRQEHQDNQQQHLITESSNHSNASVSGESSGSSVVEFVETSAPTTAKAHQPEDAVSEVELTTEQQESLSPPHRQQYRPQLKPSVQLKPQRAVNEDEDDGGRDELDETGGDDFLAHLDQTGGYMGDDQEMSSASGGGGGGKRKRDSDDYVDEEMFDGGDEYEDEFEAKRRMGGLDLDPSGEDDLNGEYVAGALMPFKCKVCGKAFKHRRSLNRHVKLHSGEKNFKCPLCASAFARSDHLKAHLRTHNNTKPYRCTVCQCGYNSQAALKVHMSHHHGRSKFRCNECDLDLHSQLALEGHMYNKHGRHASEIEAFNESHANSAVSFSQQDYDDGAEYRDDDTEDIDLDGEEEEEGDEEDDDVIIEEDEVSLNVPNILNTATATKNSYNNTPPGRPLRPLLPKAAGLHHPNNSVSPKNSPVTAQALPPPSSAVRLTTTPAAIGNKNSLPSLPLKPVLPSGLQQQAAAAAKNSPGNRLPSRPMEPGNTYCELCNARFSSADSYMAHMRNCHPSIYNQHHHAPPPPVNSRPAVVNGTPPNAFGGDSSSSSPSSVLASKMPLLTNVLQNNTKPAVAAPGESASAVSQITKVIPFSSPINQPPPPTPPLPNGHGAVNHPHHPSTLAPKVCRIPNCNCVDSLPPAAETCPRRSPMNGHEPTENAYVIKETHITCAQCSMTYIRNADYIEHLKREHCVEVFRCMLCKQMQLFDNLSLLKEHFINVHQTKKLEFYRCRLCQPAANTTPVNQLHRQVYHSIDDLNRHLQNVHQIQEPSQFTSIFAVAARPAVANPVHHPSFGPGARPPAFVTQALHHAASNLTPPPPAPPPVSERYGNNSTFNQRCFKCVHCDSDFAQLGSLNQHMLMAHNIRVPPSLASASEEPLSRPPQMNLGGVAGTGTTFSCQYCRSTFSNRIQLERHLRIHVSSIDLKCNICDRIFDNQDQLSQHKLTHCKTFSSIGAPPLPPPPPPSERNPAKAAPADENLIARPTTQAGQATAICVYCKQTIENDMQFRDHFKRHNNIGAANNSSNGGVKNNSFICIVCRQTLSSSSEYYLHLRHHLNRRQPSGQAPNTPNTPPQPVTNGATAAQKTGGNSFIARALSGELPTEMEGSNKNTSGAAKKPEPTTTTPAPAPTDTIDKYIYEDKYRCPKCLVKFEEWSGLVEHMNASHKITVPMSLLTDQAPHDEGGVKQNRLSPVRNGGGAGGGGQPLTKTNSNTGPSVTITPVMSASNGGVSKPQPLTGNGGGYHDNHQQHQRQHQSNGNENQSQQFTEACEICQIQFDSSSRLQAHLLIKHEFFNANGVFTCPVCDELFAKPESLLTHTMQHGQAAKIYKCSQCPVSFVFKSQLINHSYVHHHPAKGNGGPVHRSSGGMTENRSSLNQYGLKHPHMHQHQHRPAMQASDNNNHHGGQANNNNNRGFPPPNGLHNLVNNKSAVNWSASQAAANRLPPHQQQQARKDTTVAVNTMPSNYRCAKCNVEFASLKMYQHHFETVHNQSPLVQQTNANYSASMMNAGTKYTCPYCSKLFASQRNLNFHVRIHTGFRPFECDICQRKFTRRDNLRNHMKCHLNVRPFACPTCAKGFTRKSHLISHLETHLKSRVHTCQKCTLQFTSLSVFISHLFKEHAMSDIDLLDFLRVQAKQPNINSSTSASSASNGVDAEKDNDLAIASAAVALMRSTNGDGGLECEEDDENENENEEDDYQSQDSFEGLNDDEMMMMDEEMDENQEAAAYLESDDVDDGLMAPPYSEDQDGKDGEDDAYLAADHNQNQNQDDLGFDGDANQDNGDEVYGQEEADNGVHHRAESPPSDVMVREATGQQQMQASSQIEIGSG